MQPLLRLGLDILVSSLIPWASQTQWFNMQRRYLVKLNFKKNHPGCRIENWLERKQELPHQPPCPELCFFQCVLPSWANQLCLLPDFWGSGVAPCVKSDLCCPAFTASMEASATLSRCLLTWTVADVLLCSPLSPRLPFCVSPCFCTSAPVAGLLASRLFSVTPAFRYVDHEALWLLTWHVLFLIYS